MARYKGVKMAHSTHIFDRFMQAIKSFGIASYSLILVFIARSMFFSSPEQQNITAQGLMLGGAIIFGLALTKVIFEVIPTQKT